MSETREALAMTVTRFCEQRFAEADGIAALAAPVLAAETPRREDLRIASHCRDLLGSATATPLAGAGVVVEPHLLLDEPYCLEWWQVTDGDEAGAGTPRLLTVDLNPTSASFRDYTSLAWFAEPQRTGIRCVTGPYVDYLCTDQYTLTFTTPLLVEDRFLGVAGVDVLVRWFEDLFLAAAGVSTYDEDWVVVNRSGRVLACTGGSWVTGDLIREFATTPDHERVEPAGWEVTDCPDTPFVVARRLP